MTDPTARALIERLADELDMYQQFLIDDRTARHALATEARAYLAAKPQGEGPTDPNDPPAPICVKDLAAQWNQQADEFNKWDSLSTEEQLLWAQARAIARAAQELNWPAIALPAAVEALRRLRRWGRLSGGGYSADVVLGVVDWIDGGMVGPLPPLPAHALPLLTSEKQP